MRNNLSAAILYLISCIILAGCAPRVTPRIPQKVSSRLTAQPQRTNPWILIDSKSEKLTVYNDGRIQHVFDNLAFGASGVGEKQRRGDDKTPRGVFTIGWISNRSKFRRFIGLNYPTLADAERGLAKGIITRKTYERIVLAHNQGKTPPQDTLLGGMIGIHGIGKGDVSIHRLANWTAGCVALENKQIDQLAALVKPGLTVEIR